MFVDKYKSIQAEALGRFEDLIKKDTKVSAALSALSSGGSVPTGGTHANSTAGARANVSRTQASPQWNGETPLNFRRRLTITAIGLADFESNNTLLCKKHVFRDWVSTNWFVLLLW